MQCIWLQVMEYVIKEVPPYPLHICSSCNYNYKKLSRWRSTWAISLVILWGFSQYSLIQGQYHNTRWCLRLSRIIQMNFIYMSRVLSLGLVFFIFLSSLILNKSIILMILFIPNCPHPIGWISISRRQNLNNQTQFG